MACAHCKANVEKSLSRVDGVEEVIVDLAKGTATVSGNASDASIIDAIKVAGYEYVP